MTAASQLSSVYDYCFRRLVLANVKKDADPAREVLRIMRELGSAWQQIALQQRQAHAAGAPSSMVRPRLSAIAV